MDNNNNNNNQIIIGIDHGNSQIKTLNTTFPSGIIEHGNINPGLDNVLEYEGKYYSCAMEHASLERDKTISERYYLLTLIAIAKELKIRGLNDATYSVVTLAIGLPPGHMNKSFNEKNKQYYGKNNPIRFTYDHERYVVLIDNILLYPQGYGALAATKCGINKQNRFVIIDIGGGTVEYVTFMNRQVDQSSCYSINEGTISIASEIIAQVSSQYGYDIIEDDVSDVMSGRDTLLEPEVQNLIRSVYKQKSLAFINKLRDLRKDPRVWHIFLTGGGAQYVKDFFTKENGVNSLYVEDAINANAMGYELLAKAALAKKAALQQAAESKTE